MQHFYALIVKACAVLGVKRIAPSRPFLSYSLKSLDPICQMLFFRFKSKPFFFKFLIVFYPGLHFFAHKRKAFFRKGLVDGNQSLLDGIWMFRKIFLFIYQNAIFGNINFEKLACAFPCTQSLTVIFTDFPVLREIQPPSVGLCAFASADGIQGKLIEPVRRSVVCDLVKAGSRSRARILKANAAPPHQARGIDTIGGLKGTGLGGMQLAIRLGGILAHQRQHFLHKPLLFLQHGICPALPLARLFHNGLGLGCGIDLRRFHGVRSVGVLSHDLGDRGHAGSVKARLQG